MILGLDSHHLWSYAWAIVAVIVYLALSYLATTDPATGRWAGPIGLINGSDNRLSTSKFQFFLWTAVGIFSLVAAWVYVWGTVQLEAPPNLMLAMGYTVVTLAAAKGITTSYIATGRIVSKDTTGSRRPALQDLVTDDDGTPDLSKIQMLSWTFIAVAAYLGAIVAALQLAGGWKGMPDINQQFMVLMGIGQGAYLGMKIVQSDKMKIFNVTPPQGAVGSKVTINGDSFGTKKGSVVFGNVAAVVADGDWKDNAVQFTVPAKKADGTDFKPGDTVGVGVLQQGTTNAEWQSTNTVPFTISA